MPSATAQKIGCMKPRMSHKNAAVTISTSAMKKFLCTVLSFMPLHSLVRSQRRQRVALHACSAHDLSPGVGVVAWSKVDSW
jgi:hypothetical protein